MIFSKTHVHTDADGSMRVGRLDVSLDSVVIAYLQGHSAETIQQMYPALSLEEVYGAITFFLGNQAEVRKYLDRQRQRWDEVRQQIEQVSSPVVERLRAIREAAHAEPP